MEETSNTLDCDQSAVDSIPLIQSCSLSPFIS